MTQDYGVAAMILGKGALGIHQSGKWYTNANIDELLMQRHIAKKVRRNTKKNHLKGPAKRTAEDDQHFEESLERLIAIHEAFEGERILMRKRTIILIAIVLFVFMGSVMKVQEEKKTYRDAMQDALYIEDVNRMDESMFGHYVILAGTPKMKTGAYDPDFDIQFDYPVVYRNAFALYDTGSGSDHKVSWDKTYRSDDYPYGSTDLVGEAAIGSYAIQGDVLLHIFENSSDKLVTEELAEHTGWVYCDKSELAGVWLLSKSKTYENSHFSWLDRGMLRIGYNAKSTIGIPCTIFGYLDENGTIVPTEEYDVKYLKGILNKDEFLKKY